MTHHTDFFFFNPFLTKRKKKLDLKNERAESLQKKLYNVNKKANRLTDTVSRLEKELSQAYTNFDVDKSKQILIDKAASNIPFKLLKLSVDNDQTYDPAIRKFALTLHFYSPKAYRFIRNTFNKALPHEHTLYRWCC